MGTTDVISQCHAAMMIIGLKTTLRWIKRENGEIGFPSTWTQQMQCTRVGLARWVDKHGGGCQNVAPGKAAGVGGGKSVALTSSWARMATTLSLGWQPIHLSGAPLNSEYVPEK